MKEGKPRSRSDYDPAAVAAAEPAVQLCMWTQQQRTVRGATTTPSGEGGIRNYYKGHNNNVDTTTTHCARCYNNAE